MSKPRRRESVGDRPGALRLYTSAPPRIRWGHDQRCGLCGAGPGDSLALHLGLPSDAKIQGRRRDAAGVGDSPTNGSVHNVLGRAQHFSDQMPFLFFAQVVREVGSVCTYVALVSHRSRVRGCSSMFSRVGRKSAEIDEKWSEFGRNWAESGRTRAIPAQLAANFGHMWPAVGQIWARGTPTSATFGSSRPNLGRSGLCSHKLGRVWHRLSKRVTEIDRVWTKVDHARSSLGAGRNTPYLGPLPSLGRIGPNLTRCRPPLIEGHCTMEPER